MEQKNKRPIWVKWYKTANWKRLRLKQFAREPLCRFCKKSGIIKEGNVADHIKPHKGKMELFFLMENLQTLCNECHSGTKQRLEKSGEFGCDENGYVKDWR